MKFYNIILYFLLLASGSCNSQHISSKVVDKDRSEATALNNEALRISLNNPCNKDSIQKSIKLLEEAIKLDDSCYMCYSNKAQMFCDFKMYDEAIKVLNRYLDKFSDKFNFEELKGFIFERKGNIDSALITYLHAIKNYDLKIQSDSNDINSQLNRAFLFFFTEGDNKAKMEYEKIYEKYPNNEQVKFMKDIFFSFNRKSYINDLFPDCK
ncbi:MAG TPA: hypothetical protein VIJ75_17030 [Hanamia sp.]